MKTGKMISSPLFVVRYIPYTEFCYAFVAPKSVTKQAIARNKLRRQGYNSLPTLSLPLFAGIFFYKKQAKEATFTEIKIQVQSLITKIAF